MYDKTASAISRSLLLFLGALVLFFCCRAAWNIFIETARSSPLSPDDVYGYIIKAAQLRDGCFWQNCAALVDLKQQLTSPQADPNSAFSIGMSAHRILVVYHPLHSVLLQLIDYFFDNWLRSYIVLQWAILALLSMSISFFLLAFFGAPSAALALTLLSSTMFFGHGINHSAPSTMALALAFTSWAALKVRGQDSWKINSFIIPLLLLSHPIGKLYVAVLLVVYTWEYHKSFSRIHWFWLALALVGLTAVATVPRLLDTPILSLDYEIGGDYWTGVRGNILQALHFFLRWDQRPIVLGVVAATIIYLAALFSFVSFPDSYSPLCKKLILVLATLQIASLGVVITNYKAEVFSRVWMPLAVIIAGAAGHGLFRLGRAALHGRRYAALTSIITIVIAVFFIGLITYVQSAFSLRFHGNTDYNIRQPEIAAKHCGTIYYSNQVAATFYLSHHTLDCNSVFIPASSSSARDLMNNKKPNLLVADKPGSRELRLAKNTELRIKLDLAQLDHFAIKATGSAELKLRVQDSRLNVKESVIAVEYGWNQIFDIEGHSSLSLTASNDQVSTIINGVRTTSDQSTDWPWGNAITVEYRYLDVRNFAFDWKHLSHGMFEKLRVIDEQGSTALLCDDFSNSCPDGKDYPQ